MKVFPLKERKTNQKKNTPAYYQCLLQESLSGFKKQPITKACQGCKRNSSQLVQQRNSEIQHLLTAYQQIGVFFKEFINSFSTA